MNSDFERSPCEPSAVLPAQMSAGMRLDGETSGARGLMLAVLEDAACCIDRGRRRNQRRARRLGAEAETWVRSDGREWPFSFVNICEVLGFEVDAVRTRLLASSGETAQRRRTRLHVRGVRARIRCRAVTMPRQRRASAPVEIDAKAAGLMAVIRRRDLRVERQNHNSRPDRTGQEVSK